MRSLVLAAALIASAAHAGSVYTWTDDHGVVHYTDRPIGPSAATPVPGMTVGTPLADLKLSQKEMPEGLRGVWCQLDPTPPPAAAPAPATPGSPPPAAAANAAPASGHIEWTFRASSFDYQDFPKNYRISGDYSIKDGEWVSDQRDIGSFKIVEMTGVSLTLGKDQSEFHLQRGKCAPPAVK